MTPDQKNLVQESFKNVAPIADTAAKLFYQKLFELDPELESLFEGDMEEQGKKLMKMIATAVNGLDHLEEIVPAVQALGERHAGYGVADKDYDTVGEALIWTLQQGLGDMFTPDVQEAWVAVYTLLADTMKAAAAKAA
jgi:hemoglobin-like flavoprotein